MPALNQQNKFFQSVHSSPVKGLQSFEYQDAILLRRMEREQDITRISQAITSENFTLGILNGVSGCGKSSFLQAGLQPVLHEAGYFVVYVKFSDVPPLKSIQRACAQSTGQKLFECNDLPSLQKEYSKFTQKPWIFLFDQFEQFFTHTQDQQNAFIEGLSTWYLNHHQYSGKILLSIRSDMLSFLYELQKKLEYELTPHLNYFQLLEFSPLQATTCFRIMAEYLKVDFEEKFILQICTEELASTETGLISAIDVQILTMILQDQQMVNDRAFTHQAFERMGGIDGLLQRYMQKQLNAPNSHNRNQATLNVLLALVNLDNNVRAGLLSQNQILAKLNGTIAPELLPNILEWLFTVRLINKIVNEELAPTYELAHERLISPLRNIAKKNLSRIDQLSYNLDRRLNEWSGNRQNKRYLFNLSELWAFYKYRFLIRWEPKRSEKESLIDLSWGLWKRRLWVSSGLLGLSFGLGIFMDTPTGIIMRIRYWEFQQSLNHTYSENCAEAAPILVKAYPELAKKMLKRIQNPPQIISTLLVMCDSLISDSAQQMKLITQFQRLTYSYIDSLAFANSRSAALSDLAIHAGALGQRDRAFYFLTKAIAIAEEMNGASRDQWLSFLIVKTGELAKQTKNLSFISKGEELATKIKESNIRNKALSELTINVSELAEQMKDSSLITKGEILANKIDDDYFCLVALGKLAVKAGVLRQKNRALYFIDKGVKLANNIKDPSFSAGALSELVANAGQLAEQTKDLSILDTVSVLVTKIKDPGYQAYSLSKLAVNAGVLGQKGRALYFLKKGAEMATKVESADSGNSELSSLAVSAGELAKQTEDISFLSKGEELVNKMSLLDDQVYALSELAIKAGAIRQKGRALYFLNKGEEIANQIEDPEFLARMMSALAIKTAELAEQTKDLNFVNKGLAIANKIDDPNYQPEALIALAIAAAELKCWKKALEITQSMPSNRQVIGYAWILRLWSQRHKAPKKDK